MHSVSFRIFILANMKESLLSLHSGRQKPHRCIFSAGIRCQVKMLKWQKKNRKIPGSWIWSNYEIYFHTSIFKSNWIVRLKTLKWNRGYSTTAHPPTLTLLSCFSAPCGQIWASEDIIWIPNLRNQNLRSVYVILHGNLHQDRFLYLLNPFTKYKWYWHFHNCSFNWLCVKQAYIFFKWKYKDQRTYLIYPAW